MILEMQELLESNFSEIEADMSYTGDEIGGLQLADTMTKEWMSIKESYFMSTAKVAKAAHLNESVAEIEMLAEASIGDFKKKVVKFFQDLWARLKGMWKNFIIGVNTAVARDGKRFAVTMAKQTSALGDSFTWKGYNFNIELMGAIPQKFVQTQDRRFHLQNRLDASPESVEALKIGEALDAECAKVISGSTAATIANKFKEQVMGTEEEHKGLSTSEIKEMLEYCEGKDQAIKLMKNNQDLAEKNIAEIIKELNGLKDSEGDGVDKTKDIAAQNKFLTTAVAYQKSRKAIVIRLHSTSMSLYKAKFGQCKRILTGAAMAKNKSVAEAVMFLESMTDEDFGYEFA